MDTVTLIKGIIMIVVFIATVILMMTKKLPTIIALPLVAIVFALIAGVPLMSSDADQASISKTILQQGASRMGDAMSGLMFGAWFAQVLNRLGITKGIVRKAAELGGDKPLVTSLIFFAAASIIFTASNSLGMVILVGTIVIPIMITTGVSPFNAGLIVLLAGCAGGTIAVANWPVYVQTFGITLEDIRNNIWLVEVPFVVVAVALIIFLIKKDNGRRRAWAMPQKETSGSGIKKAPLVSYITPLVPVALVFAFKLDIVPAIIVAVIVGLILVRPKKPIHVLSSSLIEGLQDVAGALALFLGIGMLLMSVTTPAVASVLQPLIEVIIPHSAIGYMVFFILLAPFAIYRGPMNLYGLGAGISALLIASGMNPMAAWLGMAATGTVQGTCDPTNSYSVWIADFTKSDVTDFLKKSLPVVMVSVSITVIIGMLVVL